MLKLSQSMADSKAVRLDDNTSPAWWVHLQSVTRSVADTHLNFSAAISGVGDGLQTVFKDAERSRKQVRLLFTPIVLNVVA